MERWVGKLAVVTGASSGIGYVTACSLVKEGVNVAALARREDKLQDLEETVEGAQGKLLTIKCDVTSEAEVTAAFNLAEEQFGPVHILVNNAATAPLIAFDEWNSEIFQKILDTNVWGLALCATKAIKSMKDNSVAGHIININSVAGQKIVAFKGMGAYSTSKHAVTALTKYLRQELSQAKSLIKVTSCSPGGVRTEMASGLLLGLRGIPVIPENAPYLEPDDVASAVLMAISTPPTVNISEITVQHIFEDQ